MVLKEMGAALITRDNKLLLVHNTKHNSLRIEPPGGKKEQNESIEDCVIREVREELGVNIRLNGLFGVYETSSPEGGFRVHMYFAEITNGIISLQDNERDKITSYKWYLYNELIGLKELVPNMKSALSKLKEYLK